MAILSTLHDWDARLLNRASEGMRHRTVAMQTARHLSRSGDGALYLLVPLAAWLIGLDNANAYAITLALAFAIERPTYFFLKNSLKRKRPQEVVPHFKALVVPADRFSFPSGHTSAAFCFATITSLFMADPTVFLYCWAGGVALSRVLLGAHFPGDIVAGAVIGMGVATLSLSLSTTLVAWFSPWPSPWFSPWFSPSFSTALTAVSSAAVPGAHFIPLLGLS